MPNDETPTPDLAADEPPELPEWARRLGQVLAWLFVGFGVACLLGAVGVGGYTVFGATRLDDCHIDACVNSFRLATILGWTVMGVGLLVLVGLGWVARLDASARTSANKRVRLAAAVGAIGVVIGYLLSHFTKTRNQLDTFYRASEQVWTITAAIWLLVIGAVVVALFTLDGLRRPTRTDTVGLVLGVVAALVLTTVLSVGALRKGDDDQYLYATTATGQAVPPLPATLGQQRFARDLPNRGKVDIYPAGAGFLVRKDVDDTSDTPDVVAYGASGEERWHYQRTGPVPPPTPDANYRMYVQGVASYDDARVVVLSIFAEQGLYVGLDAVTGARLWTSTDPAIGRAFVTPQLAGPPARIIARLDGRWIAVDPHTGQRAWSVEDPARCPAGADPAQRLPNFDGQHVYPVDTATRVAAVVDCSSRDKINLRLVAVDPATGAVTTDQPLSALDTEPRGGLDSWSAESVPGSDAVIVHLSMSGPSKDVYVDQATGKRIDFAGTSALFAVGDGTFAVRDRRALRLYSVAAVPTCDVPLGSSFYVGFEVLRDQVVVRDEDAHVLRVFDRASCRPLATANIPPGYDGPFAVRGATLLTRTDKDGRTALVGFTP